MFKAIDQRTGTLVAVKKLLPSAVGSPDSVIEFRDEGVLLGKMKGSRNVVQMLDSGQSRLAINIGGSPTGIEVGFHVLELADGALSELLPLRHELDWLDKMRIFRDVVSGTHQMHGEQIVHRDLKVSNVLLFNTRKAVVAAKISDLGRSRNLGLNPRFTTAAYATGRGDRSYASPENLWHLATGTDKTALRRADIYLLGSVLFEIATGSGITPVVLPHWYFHLSSTAGMDRQDREASFRAAGHHMSESHEMALDVLADEVPPEIRQPVVSLVRQMCDPIPARRESRFRAERSNPIWGLHGPSTE